ncbi:MAG: exodeoxyribonuclease V subunit gamma [Aeromicrobium sp.]|uniref:exodeoxyribonuclease V subunit gamma n=1 Tax=Aeromicrobium sp. TaxID=1871063 RepID=UPI0039E33714
MTLHLHRAERANTLVDALARVMEEPPSDAFARELVVVSGDGVQRWLAQSLGHRLGAAAGREDGICASVDFVRPGRFLADLTDRDRDRDDPWSPGRLTWTVLDVIDRCLGEPWMNVVARHLGQGLPEADQALRRGRRYATARRLASLLHTYARRRPAMVQAWNDGHDTDGAGGDLPQTHHWQAELWRRVSAELDGHDSPDQRVAATAAGLRDGSVDPDLPERLSLFGSLRLTASEWDLVAALGERREAHVWVPSRPFEVGAPPACGGPRSSSHLRERSLRSLRCEGAPRPSGGTSRLRGIEGSSALLTSLGRESAELTDTLLALSPELDDLPSPERPDTLLGWLQGDLAGEGRGDRERRPDDWSVQIHATHSPARQVEVVREVVLGLLADDPTLEPRDIVVLCPDLDAFAPYLDASFGLADVPGADHPGHRLRVRVDRRHGGAANPVGEVLRTVVRIAVAGRVTASEVREFLALGPVRHRFDLSDDDLEQIDVWIAETAIRWGYDADGRGRWHLDGLAQNTWRAGLDRLLVAVAAEPGLPGHGSRLGGVLPVDDLGSTGIDLVGRLTQAVTRLGDFLAAARPQPLSTWVDLLSDTAQALASTPHRDAWQTQQVLRQLAEQTGDAELTVVEVDALLADILTSSPGRSGFRDGSLTVCGLSSLRSVPHRVVCLLGLDAAAFPRTAAPLGDDLLALRRLPGEPDPTAEDRQLLLDAITAATDHLVLAYTGANERTGQELPPATPVGELLDQLDQMLGLPAGTARRELVVRHPLQAFDARSFTPGALGADPPFSFDQAAAAGARATTRPALDPAPLLSSPLPERVDSVVALDDLRAFVAHPTRAFLRGRLDLTVVYEDDPPEDAIALDLDALQTWQVTERLLDAVLAGVSGPDAEADERRRGLLPPGPLADDALNAARDTARSLYTVAAPFIDEPAASLDVDVELPGGRRLVGAVAGVRPTHGLLVTPSKIAAKHLGASWVDALALAAAGQGRPFRLVGKVRQGRSSAPGLRTIRPPSSDEAQALLLDLLDLRDLGLRTALPLPPKTSYALADAQRQGERYPHREARREWEGNQTYGIDGEDADPYHQLAFGEALSYDDLLRVQVGGRSLPQLASRLWGPLQARLEDA